MSEFIQLHILTSYPPANLNRDDLGRPKTARMGGAERLRISSQSLKRAWRTSDLFENALSNHIGTRTKRLGTEALKRLKDGGIKDEQALKWAESIAKCFGKLDAKKAGAAEISQLVHVSPDERRGIDTLVERLIQEKREPTEDELKLLRAKPKAVDIALFGRMLADEPAHGVEAAAQVAHAISVHAITVEDDYFTAVDDLNSGEEDAGAGHLGEAGFAAAVFYLYICIDRTSLIDNLSGDKELASSTVRALVEAAAKVAPGGKQNSFASRAYASYILAEKGSQQPRSLSVAFLKPITGTDVLENAISALEGERARMENAYGACADAVSTLDVLHGKGSLDSVIAFLAE